MAIVFDESRAPLIVLRWPPRWTAEEFDRSLDELVATVRKDRRIAVVNDLLALERSPSASERKRITDTVNANMQYHVRNVAAWANVVRSPLVRGVLTALNWVTAPKYPQRAFANVDEAEAWCLEMLARAQ